MRRLFPHLTAAVTVAAVLGSAAVAPAHAEPAIALAWGDLIPPPASGEAGAVSTLVTGIASHGSVTLAPGEGETMDRLVRTYDGRRVQLDGYVVPLTYDGVEVTEFFLVPYVGACVHVPPPPPNQLVYVRTGPGFVPSGLFQPVSVTGTMSSAPDQEILDRVGHGYLVDAEEIKLFEG